MTTPLTHPYVTALHKRPDLAEKLETAGLCVEDCAKYAEELNLSRAQAETADPAAPVRGLASGSAEGSPTPVLEAIVLVTNRPTSFVVNGDFDLPTIPEVATQLSQARHLLRPSFGSVGHLEFRNGVAKEAGGTAWMVADRYAITNRHVADLFAYLDAQGIPTFRRDMSGNPYRVTVDFAEEHGSPVQREVDVVRVVYLARESTTAPNGTEVPLADIAVLEMSTATRLPPPIPLSTVDVQPDDWIAVVGFPHRASWTDRAEELYFGGIYGVKRISAGRVLGIRDTSPFVMTYDATTLGGNSGSVVIDMKSGSAVGLHFAGTNRYANYGVKGTEVLRVLQSIRVPAVVEVHSRSRWDDVASPEEEGPVSDLDTYDGYDAQFIAPDEEAFTIPLPTVTDRAPGHVAKLDAGGTVLTYRNFSIEMCRERRLCYYSAVNIDGSRLQSVPGSRPSWKIDRRLTQEMTQIKDECYRNGNSGSFSRGHMTRRVDPNWGPIELARVSNRHTFYVTNACPQMGAFNAPIWLRLEDYALRIAKQDGLRISVFTGPVFRDDDPPYDAVRVPVEFWKVIAFQTESGELSATAFVMSQQDHLPARPREESIGQFKESQRSIRYVEDLTGLDFHQLREYDPLEDGSESLFMRVVRLREPEDIIWTKQSRRPLPEAMSVETA